MSHSPLIFFVSGLLLLIAGAEALVRGSARLAQLFGIPSLVIGLTIVAFGTSSPEMAVSIRSALCDFTTLSLGNIIGSNIFNILFILGLSAIISPLSVSLRLVRLDIPILIGLSIAVLICAIDQIISRGEGVLLLIAFVGWILALIFPQRRRFAKIRIDSRDVKFVAVMWNFVLTAAGLFLLIIGSRWLVNGAVEIAALLGVSRIVIGLTVVAIGTSLPEIATSIVASIRGEQDIAVGNIVGSNIFNIVAVLGLASSLSADGIDVPVRSLQIDIPVMIIAAVACLPIFFSGLVIDRREGILLLGTYISYTAYLLMDRSSADTFPLTKISTVIFAILALFWIVVAVSFIKKRPSRSR